MTIQKTSQNNEQLSAFVDAEQSETETSQIVTHLLNDSDYKECYVRLQTVKEALSQQRMIDVRSNISQELESLPTYFVDEAVSLQIANTENVRQTPWFKTLHGQKIITGMSIAASVMFATFFSLQFINYSPDSPYDTASNVESNHPISQPKHQKNDVFFEPSETYSFAELPMLPVSYPVQWQKSDVKLNIQTVTHTQLSNHD